MQPIKTNLKQATIFICAKTLNFLKSCSNFKLYVVLIMKLSRARQTEKKTIQNIEQKPSRCSAYCLFSYIHAILSLLFTTLYGQACSLYRKFSMGLPKKNTTGRIDYLLERHEEKFNDAEFVIKPVTKPSYGD